MHRAVASNHIASSKPRPVRVPRRWVLAALSMCFASGTLLTSTPSARAEGAGVDTAARAMLPEALQKSGTLRVGLEINYAPWMYQLGPNAEGIDPGLIRAIAARLGLKPEFAFVDFAAILPGVQSGRFDVGANFANTAARRKVVSFVNYLQFAGGSVVPKGNPHKINVNDMCGLRISAGVGSFQYSNVTRMSELCVKHGKPPITIVPLSVSESINALRAGRVDAAEIGMVANTYAASQPGGQDLEALTPPTVVSAPTLGYITNNDADGIALAHAMAAALNAMIESGEYATILRKWKVPEAAELKKAFSN